MLFAVICFAINAVFPPTGEAVVKFVETTLASERERGWGEVVTGVGENLEVHPSAG